MVFLDISRGVENVNEIQARSTSGRWSDAYLQNGGNNRVGAV
jgi:hypothetical protein